MDGRQSMMRRRRTTITKGDANIDLQDDGENFDDEDHQSQLFANLNNGGRAAALEEGLP
jgi:hypothetical protein